ncbi:MAG: ScyD/ScyE family protein [Actinomycetota bacterium]
MRGRVFYVVALAALLAVIAAGSPANAGGSDWQGEGEKWEEVTVDPKTGGKKDPPAKPHPDEPKDDEPAPEPLDRKGDLEVIATGLDNPRGIDVGKRHKIYVAEAGRGGPTLVDTPLGDSEGPICVGMTGRVTRIWRGEKTTVVTTPSAAPAVDGMCEGPGTGAAATGAHGVTVRKHKRVSYTVGLGGDPEARDALVAGDPLAAAFGFVDHAWRPKAVGVDLTGFEAAADPDMQGVDSNPYGLTRIKGATLVVEAGGNTLLRVGRKGAIDVVAVFAPRCVPFMLGPNPIPPEANPCGDPSLFPADAVPTDVAVHDDGDYLVTVLGGFPFNVGASRVFKIDPDHAGPAMCSTFDPVPGSGCEVFADGLTALVGIDVDKHGKVYVVQMTDNGLLGAGSGEPGADDGSVQVLDGDGNHLGAIEGLLVPGGIAIRGEKVYVTNLSVVPGGGQVLRAPLHCSDPSRCAAYS